MTKFLSPKILVSGRSVYFHTHNSQIRYILYFQVKCNVTGKYFTSISAGFEIQLNLLNVLHWCIINKKEHTHHQSVVTSMVYIYVDIQTHFTTNCIRYVGWHLFLYIWIKFSAIITIRKLHFIFMMVWINQNRSIAVLLQVSKYSMWVFSVSLLLCVYLCLGFPDRTNYQINL